MGEPSPFDRARPSSVFKRFSKALLREALFSRAPSRLFADFAEVDGARVCGFADDIAGKSAFCFVSGGGDVGGASAGTASANPPTTMRRPAAISAGHVGRMT